MADYYPLIARAVSGLDKNTGKNRRALYDRARVALVNQLRGVQPALEESDITRERLARGETIRTGAGAAGAGRGDPQGRSGNGEARARRRSRARRAFAARSWLAWFPRDRRRGPGHRRSVQGGANA